MAKYDWDKIEHEYVTSTISMRELAERYKIPEKTLFQHAKKVDLVGQRRKFSAKVRQKAFTRDSNKAAKTLSNIGLASDKLINETMRALTEETLYGQIVEMPPVKDEETGMMRIGLQVEITPKADVKAIQGLSNALKNLMAVVKDLYPDAGQGIGNERGVIIMPPRQEQDDDEE